MPEHESKSMLITDARLIFRNFTGREREFNSEGDRNFSIVLPPERAKAMLDEGWRVKQLKPRDEESEGDYHIKVTVNYKKGRPPRVVLITSGGRTELGADEVTTLDVIEIKKADVMINGWWSDMAGGGYGAFLKSIFITMDEDELELMYAVDEDSDKKDDLPPWNTPEEENE